MPDGQGSSAVSFIALDADSLSNFPADIRRAAELVCAFLDGATLGRLIPGGSTDAQAPSSLSGQDARKIVEDAVAAGGAPLRISVCGPISGDTSRVSAPMPPRDVVVVWGPNVAATIENLFNT